MKLFATAAAFFASAVLSMPVTTGSFTNIPMNLIIGTNFTITWESTLQDTVYLAYIASGLKPYGEAYSPFIHQYVPLYYSRSEFFADLQPSSGSYTWTVEPLPDYTGLGLQTYGPDYVYRFALTPTHVGVGFSSTDFILVEP
ncbi:hypothetical protein GGR57DRAFT_494623 [Xylariaceae sp. FL1272]|nr:hypothetical protein GGR57DRAFT_494623 [Xylariaceae sp. FL1272]